MFKNTYTHRDPSGMYWRFQGSRPVSLLADIVMKSLTKQTKKKKWKRKSKA